MKNDIRLFKQLLCLFLALFLCFAPDCRILKASSYELTENCTIADGFTPPDGTTIIHYLNNAFAPYTKVANIVRELWVGDEHRFTVAANRREKVNVSWSSSNHDVATINKKTGELTARSVGDTTITMSDTFNKTKQKFRLTVQAVPVLPEIPQEWYTVEDAPDWYPGDGITLKLKPEYRYLYGQCSMLRIPDEIDEKRVVRIRMDNDAWIIGQFYDDWGFEQLKILQCNQEVSCHAESYRHAIDEFIYSEDTVWADAHINCKKLHIPAHTRLINCEEFINPDLEDVRIPASIKLICRREGDEFEYGIYRGERACFSVDGNNTNYYSIFGVLFSYPYYQIDYALKSSVQFDHGAYVYCVDAGKTLLAYPKNKTGSAYRIPDGIEQIGQRAFAESKYLKRIVLPDSVTRIGISAFADMEQEVEIVIPASVTEFAGPIEFDYYSGKDSNKNNITFITPKGSAAEAYAIKNGIKYRNE